MIFQYTWPQIVLKKKTATRRKITENEFAVRGKYNKIVKVVVNNHVKWQVGSTYAVQPGRGQKQIARIRLTRITQQQLKRISSKEAQAEGFVSRKEFMKTWEAIHGKNSKDRRVWVLQFELVEIKPEFQQLRWDDLKKTANVQMIPKRV